MKIGIITGKDDEISLNKEINKLVPKKYYENGNVHTDIALAYLMKTKFVGVNIDIIQPKDITNQRLKKNDINFVIGYDVINVINDDLLIYPNPAYDYFVTNKDIDLIEIFDVSGKRVRSFKNISVNQPINIESLETGYYFLKLKASDYTYNKKLIKK